MLPHSIPWFSTSVALILRRLCGVHVESYIDDIFGCDIEDGTLRVPTDFAKYLIGNDTALNPGLQRPLLWADVLVTVDRPLSVRTDTVIEPDTNFTTSPPYECTAASGAVTLSFESGLPGGFPDGELDIESVTVDGVACEPTDGPGGDLMDLARTTISCVVQKSQVQQASPDSWAANQRYPVEPSDARASLAP